MLVAEREGCRKIVLALLAQVSADAVDGLGDPVARRLDRGFEARSGLRRSDLIFYARVKLVEGTGGLGRLVQNIAACETGKKVCGIVKTKLMGGAVGAQELELSVLELGIHLQNGDPVFGILVRIHRSYS